MNTPSSMFLRIKIVFLIKELISNNHNSLFIEFSDTILRFVTFFYI